MSSVKPKTLITLAFFQVLLLSGVAAEASEAVREAISKLQPNAKDVQISPSPIPGISEVAIGLQVLYVSNDGEFALGGPMLSLAKGVNLTERSLAGSRVKLLDDSSASTFHYPAAKPKHQVTVFTDIDCPHCRRMHNELPAMQAAGIDVKYVLLPRAGVGSASYVKSVSAACAQDPEASITAAMNGKKPPTKTCEHPIDDHLELSRSLNVSSTPSIVLEDGQLVLGYHSAEALLKVIAQRTSARAL
ncbi:MAG: DsbC family protein [Gammaproteobacteria bacterium]